MITMVCDAARFRDDRRPVLRIALSGFAFAALLLSACSAERLRETSMWSAAPPMLHARAAHAVVGTGGALYALAGTGEGGKPVLEVERFDGTRWQRETTLPGDGLNAPAAAIVGNRIYLIGGFGTSTNNPASDVHVYDLTSKTWERAAPLPAPRGGHAAVVLDGEIHVVGGGNSRTTIADHSAFNPRSNTWRDLAHLPRAEGSPAVAVLGGRIYAIGGRSGNADFGDVFIYDAASDAWQHGPAIGPRGTAGAVEYCGSIFLFGGESQSANTVLSSVLRLNAQGDGWDAQEQMPTPRSFARAVRMQDAVYVVGGSPTPGNSHASTGSAVVERFRIPCNTWPISMLTSHHGGILREHSDPPEVPGPRTDNDSIGTEVC